MDLALALRRLPKTLQIGAYDYRILIADDDPDHWGLTDIDNKTITIWPRGMRDSAFLVGIVIHEITHVIYHNADLDLGAIIDEPEERIVIEFEQGLVSLYRNNPKLLTWIKKCLK